MKKSLFSDLIKLGIDHSLRKILLISNLAKDQYKNLLGDRQAVLLVLSTNINLGVIILYQVFMRPMTIKHDVYCLLDFWLLPSL